MTMQLSGKSLTSRKLANWRQVRSNARGLKSNWREENSSVIYLPGTKGFRFPASAKSFLAPLGKSKA